MKRWTAGWMVALGLLAMLAGWAGIGRWTAISTAARIYYSVALAVGAAAVICGASLWPEHPHWPSWQ